MRRKGTSATVQCVAGQALYLGMDFGTSGARAIVIDGERDHKVPVIPVCLQAAISYAHDVVICDHNRRGLILPCNPGTDAGALAAEASQSYSEASADGWADTWRRCPSAPSHLHDRFTTLVPWVLPALDARESKLSAKGIRRHDKQHRSEATDRLLCSALFSNLEALGGDVRKRLKSVAIDGTSSTAMLTDRRDGSVLASPKLYNEGQPDAAVAAVHVSDSALHWCLTRGLCSRLVSAGPRLFLANCCWLGDWPEQQSCAGDVDPRPLLHPALAAMLDHCSKHSLPHPGASAPSCSALQSYSGAAGDSA